MRKLLHDTKGAVTVFVTLLLIPAILVSGTAVDLARIHTARSILQDANQMAANSVLTQYNALLYDLYGLFGVAQDDPILGKLLDDYIKVAVFGEKTRDKSLGTLQLFYGANVSLDEPLFASDKSLRNEDVLRRQIEDYMKFRGPVIIVKEFLDALEGNKIKEDTKTISDKLEIESGIADLYDKYKELYDAIVAADKCNQAVGGVAGGSFGAVSSSLVAIRGLFVELANCYAAWESVDGKKLPAVKSSYAQEYRGILSNIMALTTGGQRGSNWGGSDWAFYYNVTGLNTNIENAKAQADNFKAKFDAEINIAREIDAINSELTRKVDALESKLKNGECSDELRQALTEKQGTPPMTVTERYRDILKWNDIAGMSTAYKNGGFDFIDNKVKPMLDGVRYRNINSASAGSLSRVELASLTSNSQLALSAGVGASNSKAAIFAGFPENAVTYGIPPGFLKFSEHPGANREFFEALKSMLTQPQLNPVKIFDGQGDEGGANAEKKQRNLIDALLKLVDTAYTGMTNNPLGAKHIGDSKTPARESLGILEILKLIPKALSSPVVDIISDPLGSLSGAGDYVLLLTYCTSMFSNYTTTRPESIGKAKDDLSGITFPKSITGVPISPKVNYFFQSEWEYLYEGHENAGKNLNAVTTLIFLVRLICNYIVVFNVSAITAIVSSIQASFAWCPPLGLVLGELARAAFVAAETVIDVAALRSGHKVPLLKNVAGGEWVCSPSGVLAAVKDIAVSEAADGDKLKKEKGLAYSNYMQFLFIAKAVVYVGSESDAATELVKRAGNLIEWNVINYQNDVNADEDKMAGALTSESRFTLEKMKTGFSLTATADLRMLFLSMVFAQNFSNARGVGIQATMPIKVTDYRGY